MRKLIVVLLSCLLAVSGFAVTPQVAEAAPAVSLKLTPAKPVQGATFAVTGTLPTKVKRPVELQTKVGDKWTKVVSGTTDAKGKFSLKASTTRSSLTVRVVAAKAKVGATSYAKVTSKTKKITTAKPSISASKVTPAKPIKGETFAVTGSVAPKVKRPVELQAKVGGKWKKIASGKTDAKGKYSFKTSTKASSVQLRVVAAKKTIAKVGHPKLTGKTVTVKTVAQTAKLSIASSAYVNQAVTAKLTFTPSRSGRAAQVQVLEKGKWVTLAKGTQDAKGVSSISLVGTNPGTYQYRAHVPAAKGAAAVSSKAVKVTIKNPDDARPVKIAVGGSHTCALLSGGKVKCWGDNGFGQLALDPTTGDRVKPVAVSGLSGAAAVAAGYSHTCALESGGKVKCWGYNWDGQLGDGTTIDYRVKPVAVSGLSGAIAIAAGRWHTCALVSGGKVKCWGRNGYGQLGDGTNTERRVKPVTVSGLSGATAIAAGRYHTCALVSGGKVKCWGWNRYGQLGDGTNTERRVKPVTVSGLSGVTAIAAGGAHTCALVSAGAVNCWGNNWNGQLGDGTTTDYRVKPVTVSGLSGVTAIAAGDVHSCAVVSAGAVNCWGWNGSGQLGDGTTERRIEPAIVSGLSGASVIAAGDAHTCTLLLGGKVKCWGANNIGQLGDGTTKHRLTPVQVVGLG